MKYTISVQDLAAIIVREEQAAKTALSAQARKVHLDLAGLYREKAAEQHTVVRLTARLLA